MEMVKWSTRSASICLWRARIMREGDRKRAHAGDDTTANQRPHDSCTGPSRPPGGANRARRFLFR